MMGSFWGFMMPPAVTIGIWLILWLSIPWMSTLLLVFAMTLTSSPAIHPFAPWSMSEPLAPEAWHDEMLNTIDAVLTCL